MHLKKKKQIKSQLKKIMPKTMNFGLPNLLNKKKKLRNTTKCYIKNKFRNITKCHNIFTIYFISSLGRPQFDILLLLFFYVHNIFRTNLKLKIIIGFKIMH